MYAKPAFVPIDIVTETASCQPAPCKYDGGVHVEPDDAWYVQIGPDNCWTTPPLM